MWYLQKKGRTEGPIPDATLMHAIEKGDIGPLDLLFKEGEDRWRAAAEYSELRERFQLAQVADSVNEDEWIILSKVRETKSFKQKGPFKTSEVRSKLKAGEILWSDYAWRDGMKEWYRITALEIFHGTPSKLPDDLMIAPLPKVGRKATLDNVETLNRPAAPVMDEKPPEADGPDLTQKVNAKEEKKPKKQAKKQPPKIEPEITQTHIQNQVIFSRRLSLWDRFREMSPSQRWWVSAGISSTVILIAVCALFYSSYRDYIDLQLQARKPVTKERVETVVAAPVVPEPVVAEEPVVENLPDKAPQVTTPVKSEEKVIPTRLNVQVRKNRSIAPQIDIQSNGSSHYPFTLKITGRLASVVGAKSYFRQISVKTLEDRKVDLAKYNIKPGYYDVRVEFNGEKKLLSEANLEVGVAEKDFRGELYAHRKSLSHWATNERVQLIKLSVRADEQLEEFLKQSSSLKGAALQKFTRSWQKRFGAINSQTLRSISGRNRNNYVFAESWLELKDFKLRVFEQTAAFTRAKDASQSEQELKELKSLKGDLSRFKEKVISTTIFK